MMKYCQPNDATGVVPGYISGSECPIPGKEKSLFKIAKNYLLLTKPMIMLLVLLSGATVIVIEGRLLSQPGQCFLFLLGLYLSGGSANALNQYFERDIDSRMSRTRYRRPLPLNRIAPQAAIIFAVTIGTAGVILLGTLFNLLTGAMALGTIIFYGLYYTRTLKRDTKYNIVIGGIAGAMAPLGAWVAVTGSVLSPIPWMIFLIIFLWTPPHFWSLAIRQFDDYRTVGLPMMPVAKGIESTIRQIRVYIVLLILASIIYGIFYSGVIYRLISGGLGLVLAIRMINLVRQKSPYSAGKMFVFSIIYLLGLFLAMIFDKFILI